MLSIFTLHNKFIQVAIHTSCTIYYLEESHALLELAQCPKQPECFPTLIQCLSICLAGARELNLNILHRQIEKYHIYNNFLLPNSSISEYLMTQSLSGAAQFIERYFEQLMNLCLTGNDHTEKACHSSHPQSQESSQKNMNTITCSTDGMGALCQMVLFKSSTSIGKNIIEEPQTSNMALIGEQIQLAALHRIHTIIMNNVHNYSILIGATCHSRPLLGQIIQEMDTMSSEIVKISIGSLLER